MTGRDVAAGFVFRTPFFYGLDHVIGKIMAPVPKPSQVAMTITESLPIGSNGIAVAASKSADGATRLLVNSHQPYTGSVAWYEAVLDSGEGWHVAGGFFPGSPFMLHGHNAHLGWANTVNAPNVSTVYRLDVNPANPDQYRMDGEWKSFEKGDAAIRVKIFGPLIWTVHRPLLWSVQGPVFKTDHGVFAVRYAGMGEARQSLQYYRLNKAANRDEWLAAMRLQALPSINYIYADEKGNIGYVYNGQFPVRAEGRDWTQVQPGDRSDLIWQGYLPFERVPQIWNPKSGYVFNSNNTPFQATGAEDALKPADFSPAMGIQTDMTNRAYRAQETFGADAAITAEAFRAYKFDLAYSDRSDIAREIAEVRQGRSGFRHRSQCRPSAAQGLGPAHQYRQPGGGAGGADAQRSRAFGQPSRRAAHRRPASRHHDPEDSLRPHRSGVGPGQPHPPRQARFAHRWRPGHLSRRLRRCADGRHPDRIGGRHFHHVRHLGQGGRPILGQHQPVRLGHVGFAFAPLCRPDAAVRGHEDQAGTVHAKPARRKRRGRLPSRRSREGGALTKDQGRVNRG